MAAKKDLLPKALLASCSVLISLGLAEAVVRRLPDSQRLLLRPSEIPGVAYRLAPNTIVRMPPGEFKVGSHGFRYPEFPEKKPEGEFRVVALGDSIVFGQGTAKDDVSAVLEKSLNEKPPKGFKTARVINTGVPSYSTCQEISLLAELIEPKYRPDLVIVGYAANDPEGARVPFGLDLATGRIAPWWRAYHWIKGRSSLLKYAVQKLSPAIVRLRGRSTFAPPVDPGEEVKYVSTLHDPSGEHWKKTSNCINAFGAQQLDGPLVVLVIFPLFNHLDAKPLIDSYARVESRAKESMLSVLNLHGAFAKLPKETLDRYRGDGMHPSEEGHRFIAGLIRAHLDANPAYLKGRP